ncbi:Unknown protein, partial [Striga hermonthica]
YKMPLVEIIRMMSCNKNFLIAYAILKDKSQNNYDWVLKRLRDLIGPDVHPSVIVTDRELGLINPIIINFPTSAHLLCTWHINKDGEHKVYNLSQKNTHIATKFTRG